LNTVMAEERKQQTGENGINGIRVGVKAGE
jgi:hypothetical protein